MTSPAVTNHSDATLPPSSEASRSIDAGHSPDPSVSSMNPDPTSPPATRHVFTPSWFLFNLIIPIAIVVVAVATVIALGKVAPSQRPPADASYAGRMKALTPVRTERVKALSDFGRQLQLQVDGTVVPYREVRLATEVAGKIIFKSDQCEAGAFVKKGDLLMRIDPTDYELEVTRLTRLKEQEYEALGEVDQEMANTKRLIEVAIQDETLQQREVQRLQSLPGGFASEGEIDKARRAVLQSTQQRVGYENQLELLRKRRARLEASERLASAQLETARVNLERTEIRSPIDGVIVNEDAELNTFVARGNPIVTIEDTTKVEVATNLRMDQLYWVLDQADRSATPGNAQGRGYDLPETPAIVEFEISGREGKVYRWDGRLLSYDGIGLDPTTRTVPVRILVDNPSAFETEDDSSSLSGPSTLVRGMYVTVKLLIEPRTPLVVIPAAAMKPGNRAWEFVPDETVLEVAAQSSLPGDPAPATTLVSQSENESTLGSSPESTSVQPQTPDETSDEDKTDGFDPAAWQAGRIVNRDSIFPVDSLSVAGEFAESDQDNPLQNGDKKWWVCEVKDQRMKAGAYVVVSPVGTVEGDTMPARMRTMDASGIAAEASSTTTHVSADSRFDVTKETAK
ncbi:efflux RND transporter periplasmic adaptor subunit [Novipirellula caenicola]|uniref:Multidrug resistance protein MdtA n=1 Tax=Novipirellula caenicola TaxID=1536901 RepID=A0ABP9VME1_9BACT